MGDAIAGPAKNIPIKDSSGNMVDYATIDERLFIGGGFIYAPLETLFVVLCNNYHRISCIRTNVTSVSC